VKDAQRYGLAGPVARWSALRARIHATSARTASTARGVFVQRYGARDARREPAAHAHRRLPAAPRPARAPRRRRHRARADRRRARAALSHEDDADGLPPAKGVFLPARSGSPMRCLARPRTRRERLFERLLALRNDVGLLAEEYDPRARACSATSRRRSPTWR
jgi:hypothetical protein